jgi:hypothetical protein
VKGNLGADDHAFPEQDENHPPENLEEEEHRRVPGNL